MAKRTAVEFPYTGDPWPIIDAWATRTGHTVSEHGSWGRRCQRGDGFFQARSYVLISAGTNALRIESWIIVWFTGGEMDVTGHDPIQYVPRRRGRKLLNELLKDLGQPTIP